MGVRRVLVACEESQAVTIAFREQGHEAYSCDLWPATGGHPEWHIEEDVLPLLKNGGWDLIIAFPPCTHLAASGALHFKSKQQDGRQQKAMAFFMACTEANANKVAIENPVGIMSTAYREPDQIVQPWMFGDPYTKGTCLWLKGLPTLRPTKIVAVQEEQFHITKAGKKLAKWMYDQTDGLSHKKRQQVRSRTFPGLARAMAQQWGQAKNLLDLI